MYVKIMGAEDAPDDDTRKCFRLIEGVSYVAFQRDHDGTATIRLRMGDDFLEEPGEEPVEGNVYVMNDNGKTIASFGPATIKPEELGMTLISDEVAAIE